MLFSDKNIVCFDMLDHILLKEAKEFLNKRVRFIKTKFDDKNRIVFSEKEFLNALSAKPGCPNTEFMEKYMFPEGVKAKLC